MLAASKVKMSGSAKKQKNVDNNTYDISSIKRVTRNSKFLEVSTFSRAIEETAEKCTKKSALHVQRFFFWLLDLLLFFYRSRCLCRLR